MIKQLMLALVATGACSLALAQQPPHDDHPEPGRPMEMERHEPPPPPPPHHRQRVWVPASHDSHGHSIKGHYIYR